MSASLLSGVLGPAGYFIERGMIADGLGTGEAARQSNISPTATRETSRTDLPLTKVDIARAARRLGRCFPNGTFFEYRAAGLTAHHVSEKYSGLRAESSFTVVCLPHSKLEPDSMFASSNQETGLVAVTFSRDMGITIVPGTQQRHVLRRTGGQELVKLDDSLGRPVVEQLHPGDVLLVHPRLVLGLPGTIRYQPPQGSTLVLFLGFRSGLEIDEENRVTPPTSLQHVPVEFKQEREL